MKVFHMNWSRFVLFLFLTAGIRAPVPAQTTGTTNLSVTVSPEASITINTANTTLTSSSTFAPFTGTTSFTYIIRTSASGGSGNIQVQITSDFSPAGGPSVASPPSVGDTLSYTCTVSSPGTACSGSITSSTSAQTSVATYGADAHSDASGNSGSVNWTLTNDPAYAEGSYTAVATFTISAS